MTRSAPLAIVLVLQALLLFCSLGLLPAWNDELFTVNTVAHPVREIVPIVRQDIHPPLYFMALHAWRVLPLPWTGVARLRAFSALWALLATLLLDLFWTRSWRGRARWLALSLFAFSPCLLLYGRMARSYSMQAALVLLAVAMLLRWMRAPRSLLTASLAFAAILALLYTHYAPGAAVLAGLLAAGWSSVGPARLMMLLGAVAAGYAPWAMTLMDAVRRWGAPAGFSASYALSGNRVLEHLVKIGFGVVSLTVGESFPVWSLALVPVILLLAVRGARTKEFSRPLLMFVAIAGLVGYLGVSRWVSYPFIPARLLWGLPFLTLAAALGINGIRRPALRSGVAAAVLLSYASSICLYFRRENFLNLGYVAPLPEIAATLNRDAWPGDLILVDAYNTDFQALAATLSGRTPSVVLDDAGVPEARRQIPAAATVWIVRNTRDASPGHTTTAIESQACADRPRRDTLLDPYAGWQQTALKLAGMRLTHFYQITVCGPGAGLGAR